MSDKESLQREVTDTDISNRSEPSARPTDISCVNFDQITHRNLTVSFGDEDEYETVSEGSPTEEFTATQPVWWKGRHKGK